MHFQREVLSLTWKSILMNMTHQCKKTKNKKSPLKALVLCFTCTRERQRTFLSESLVPMKLFQCVCFFFSFNYTLSFTRKKHNSANLQVIFDPWHLNCYSIILCSLSFYIFYLLFILSFLFHYCFQCWSWSKFNLSVQ